MKKIKEKKWKKNFASSTNLFTMGASFDALNIHCHNVALGSKEEDNKMKKMKKTKKMDEEKLHKKPKVIRARTLESRRKEFKKSKKDKRKMKRSKSHIFLYEPTMHSRRDLKEFEAAIGVSWHDMTT